ncbi:hypothetical protein TRIP_D440218 [uncultured Paludibacter sp.]|nr:hypothetical protein TRIP_D440218 [uncultured Paludibacter sp.]
MEKNILIKFTAESDLSKVDAEMQSLRDREKEISLQMQKLQSDYQKQVYGIQSTNKSREEQIQLIEKVRQASEKQQKSLSAEMTKTKASLADFTQKMSNVNDTIAKGAISTPKFTTQLRAMKDELAKMEEAGQFGTKAFTNLAIKAGQLEDQIGDTRQRISILSSDTKNLDAVMGLGQGLAGGFTAATSAAALLGGESEELQQAFFKVQAALQILNGVQMVANTLNKDSVANVVLQTALENNNTVSKIKNTVSKYANIAATKLEAAAENGNKVAKIGSTAAQWALNSSMLANPAFWLIGGIMALVGAYYLFSSSAKEAKQAQAEFNAELDAMKRISDGRKKDLDFDIKLMQAAGKSEEDVLKKRRENNDKEIKDAEASRDKLQVLYNKADKKRKEEMKQGLDESNKLVQDAYDERRDINESFTVLSVKNQTDANKKHLEEQRKAGEKSKQEREKRNQEIAQAQSDLDDLLNDLMIDGMLKEVNIVQTTYDRKIAAIKGDSEAEIQLREQLKTKENQEIQKIETKYANQSLKTAKELELLKTQNAEAGSADDIALKKATLQKQAELDILNINQSTDSEETKAEKIKAINIKLGKDLAQIDKDNNQKRYDDDLKLFDEFSKAYELALKKQYENGEISKEEYTSKSKQLGIDELETEIALRKSYGEDTIDLELELSNRRIAIKEDEAEKEKQMWNSLYENGKKIAGYYFDYIKDKLSTQLEDLDNYYTTDAEEAKNNSDKKLITEKALAQKKLEIKRKQAQVEKQEAMFNIFLSTAQAIIGMLKDPGGIQGTIMSIAAGVTGTVQAAMVASKPLPQYAKGRKGGRGEFAKVGEQGPEVMWVPDGASIIPAHRNLTPNTLKEFGIKITGFDKNIMELAMQERKINFDYNKLAFDYDKLSKSITKNIKQNNISISVDKNGINVQDGNLNTNFINKKYSGKWSN